MNLLSLIPLPYRIAAIAALVIGLAVWSRVEWNHSVTTAANKVITAYVARKTKDDADLSAIELKTNTKIQLQYLTEVKTIHDEGISNVQIVTKYMHDAELLSNSWVSVHDLSAANKHIEPAAVADGSNSAFTATEALATVVTNYATCNEWKAEVDAWQQWVVATNADITRQNQKAK